MSHVPATPTPRRAVLLDAETFSPADLDWSALEAAVPELVRHGTTAPGEVVARLAGAAIAISNKVVLDAGVLAACPELKLICVAATGTNNVDLAAAREHGIAVCNARGYGTPSVVQHTWALILALATRLPDYHAAVSRGDWARASQFCLLDFPIAELAGRTLGIVGYGELGQAVAAVAPAFGMQVLVAQLPGRPAAEGRVPLAEVLARADVLSLHCPLTETTRGLIGAAELARMKPDALLINTARGGIVDEAALAEALRGGRLGGAGVDVLGAEPPRDGNPLLAPDLPNLIVTPHTAWASRGARQRLVEQVAENIRAFGAGTPLRRVV